MKRTKRVFGSAFKAEVALKAINGVSDTKLFLYKLQKYLPKSLYSP